MEKAEHIVLHMLQPHLPLITRHDYEAMPEGPPYYQVIEGDLIMSPSPNTLHQTISRNILEAMLAFLRKHRIGKVYYAPLDVFLSETNVFQPDIIFVTNERASIVTRQGIEGGPDLVIEILSAGTARYDRNSKRKIYGRTGIRELWLVDPDLRQIDVFDLQKDAELPSATHGAESAFSSMILPGLKFKSSEIIRD